MIDFIYQIFYPAKIKELEAEIKSTRRALRFAVKFFTDLQGCTVTQNDVKELLNEVRRLEVCDSKGNRV